MNKILFTAVKVLGGFEDGAEGVIVKHHTKPGEVDRVDVRILRPDGKNAVLSGLGMERIEPLPLVALAEDGTEVREGDLVFNYYDGEWGKVTDMRDTFDALRYHADYPDHREVDPNQDLWFYVNGTSLNGQRVAKKDPSGRYPKPQEV